MFVDLIISALVWMTFATLVAQTVSIGLMWWLGLPPKKLAYEIEEVQNPAVGACFFIIALAASLFISLLSSGGFSPAPSLAEELFWIVGGLIVASLYTWLAFIIAHRLMGRENNENVLQYIRRELIQEQNVSLAFFLGGLAIAPFIAVAYQII